MCGRLEIFDQAGREWSVRPPQAGDNTEKHRERNGKKTVSFCPGDNHGQNNEDFPIDCSPQDNENNNYQSEEFNLREIDNLTKQLLGKTEEIETLKNQLVAAEEGKLYSEYELQKELEERERSAGGEIRKQDRKLSEPAEADCHYLQLEGQLSSLQSNLQVKAEQVEQINSLLTQAEDVLIEKEKEISWLNDSISQMEQSLKVNRNDNCMYQINIFLYRKKRRSL